jgi:hypothetical protein
MTKPKDADECSRACGCYPPIGTRVVVVDGSEAHGDEGVVWDVSNSICLIELDAGCIWPISEPWEVKVLCG